MGDEPAVVTPLYLVFRAKPGAVDPNYLLLACNGDHFFDSLSGMLREGARAHGALNVRVAEFFAASVPLPPLAEQRRIVDVVAAVDSQIHALTTELAEAREMARLHRACLVDDPGVTPVKAIDAFEFSAGVRRTPERAVGPDQTLYLRSANIGYGRLRLDDVQQMHYSQDERARFGLQAGDVLVSEGSASASAVGMPAMWRDELPGPVCFQMTLLRLRARIEVCLPEFMYQWCLWAYESGAFLDVCGGSSIKHISLQRSSQMPVRLPDLDRQHEVSSLLAALGANVAALEQELVALRAYRAGLLAALLSQQVEIPESYDALLSDALEVSA